MRIFFVCIILFIFSGCATLPEYYMALDERKTLSLNEVLKRIENERLLFVGERHTNSSDHLFQLEVIRHLRENGKKVTIALEVFPSEKQKVLDSWANGTIGDHDFEIECDRVWDMLYWYYGKIFEYARGNGISLFGVGAEKSYINRVATKGLNIVPEDKLKEINFTGCKEDPSYENLMKSVESRGVHKMKLSFFCDAQRLSDENMAYNIARLLVKDDYTVVVLLGAAHASKIAVPKMLKKYLGVDYKVLLPENFRAMTGKDIDKSIADYIWF